MEEQQDKLLWLGTMALHVLAEEIREILATTAVMKMSVKMGYMANWRTQEWKAFASKYGMTLVDFDQGCKGHPKRKPTTLGTNMTELYDLHGMRGDGFNPDKEARDKKTLQERCAESRTWSAWAPGLKKAMVFGLMDRPFGRIYSTWNGSETFDD